MAPHPRWRGGERERAQQLGYPSPIQPTKEDSDKALNDALEFCVANRNRIAIMCGSHNEQSNKLLTQLMAKNGISNHDDKFWFAQLYGMSDNISFNLAKAGFNAGKYVIYGPVREVTPYLIRRAEENTSVSGDMSREYKFVLAEIKRRKLG